MSDSRRLALLGQELRSARAKKGLRLREVSQLLGVAISTIHAWEHGDNHVPGLRLVELGGLLGVPLDKLARRRAFVDRAA